MNNPLLASILKVLEFTARTIQRSTNAKAVTIVIVHDDATIQTTALIQPGIEERAVKGLRSLADKIEKGEEVKSEMSKELKN